MSANTLPQADVEPIVPQIERIVPSPVRLAGVVVAGLFIALVTTLIAAALTFGMTLYPLPPDLRDLLIFLLISGAVSIMLGAIVFRMGLGTRIPSIALTLALVYLVGAAVVGINVWYTSHNMFLNKEHDLPLLTILLIFSGIISLFFAYFLSQSMVARLHSLLGLSRRVAGGDLSARVHVSSRDEIGRLGEAFNDMVLRLEESRQEKERLEASRRDLIASVSHDLRTPLASMRAMVEALNDGVVTDDETISRYLHTIQHETRHLSTLIDDLFELSQIDAGVLKLQLEPTAIEDLVSDALQSMAPQAQKKNVQLQGQVEGNLPRLPLDSQRMQRVLYNLIQNAIRHTPADGTVVITVRGGADRVELVVRDTGEGISPTDLPHIFDRFYRGEPARTRSGTSGAGRLHTRYVITGQWGRLPRDPALSHPTQVRPFPIVPRWACANAGSSPSGPPA
jgi:signal transduction histidine kinase